MNPETSATDVVAAVIGPLFYRRWFSREPVDDRFIETTIAAVVEAALLR